MKNLAASITMLLWLVSSGKKLFVSELRSLLLLIHLHLKKSNHLNCRQVFIALRSESSHSIMSLSQQRQLVNMESRSNI